MAESARTACVIEQGTFRWRGPRPGRSGVPDLRRRARRKLGTDLAALRRETVPVNMAMYGTTEYWEERYRAMG